jgi:hypothetical protein
VAAAGYLLLLLRAAFCFGVEARSPDTVQFQGAQLAHLATSTKGGKFTHDLYSLAVRPSNRTSTHLPEFVGGEAVCFGNGQRS